MPFRKTLRRNACRCQKREEQIVSGNQHSTYVSQRTLPRNAGRKFDARYERQNFSQNLSTKRGHSRKPGRTNRKREPAFDLRFPKNLAAKRGARVRCATRATKIFHRTLPRNAGIRENREEQIVSGLLTPRSASPTSPRHDSSERAAMTKAFLLSRT